MNSTAHKCLERWSFNSAQHQQQIKIQPKIVSLLSDFTLHFRLLLNSVDRIRWAIKMYEMSQFNGNKALLILWGLCFACVSVCVFFLLISCVYRKVLVYVAQSLVELSEKLAWKFVSKGNQIKSVCVSGKKRLYVSTIYGKKAKGLTELKRNSLVRSFVVSMISAAPVDLVRSYTHHQRRFVFLFIYGFM